MITKRLGHLAWVCFAGLLWATQASAQLTLPTSWNKEGVPDFTQYAWQEWGTSWCAPTAAMNSICYYSSHGYSGLTPGVTWGDDNAVDELIDEMGGYMGTHPSYGTTDENIRDGWQQYCNEYYPQSGWPHFQTRLLSVDDFESSEEMWEAMREELYRCQDVLPLVSWDGGGGHAITMVGWTADGIVINDPANNPNNEHNWDGEYLPVDISFEGGGIALSWGSGTGVIDAFAVTCPEIPEPATLVLLGAGLSGLVVVRVRRTRRM